MMLKKMVFNIKNSRMIIKNNIQKVRFFPPKIILSRPISLMDKIHIKQIKILRNVEKLYDKNKNNRTVNSKLRTTWFYILGKEMAKTFFSKGTVFLYSQSTCVKFRGEQFEFDCEITNNRQSHRQQYLKLWTFYCKWNWYNIFKNKCYYIFDIF